MEDKILHCQFPAAPARHRSLLSPGFFFSKLSSSVSSNLTVSANIEASPAAPPSPLTRPAVNPGVATGLPLSILAWQQDCPCQSWRGNRIASPNPALTTGMPRCITSSSDQQGHPRAPTAPRGGLRRRRLRAGKSQKDAADDLSDVAESYKGMSEKIRHALLRVPGRKAYDILLPGIGARPRLPGIEASCRAHAKVEILPSKKKCRGCRTTVEKNFQWSCGGQLPLANLPGRAAPARRHGGHAADVSHQLRSSGRLFRPLAPSCAGLAFDRQNRSNQKLSHPKKPWRGPGAGSKTEAAEPASLQDRSRRAGLALKVTHGL